MRCLRVVMVIVIRFIVIRLNVPMLSVVLNTEFCHAYCNKTKFCIVSNRCKCWTRLKFLARKNTLAYLSATVVTEIREFFLIFRPATNDRIDGIGNLWSLL